MSIRLSKLSSGANAANAANAASTQQVHSLLKQAQVANSEWLRSSSTNGLMSPQETLNNWKLEFEKTVKPSKIDEMLEVTHTLVLKNGAYTNLTKMMDALTAALQTVYSGWNTEDSGTLLKVCAYPDKSTATWKFSIDIQKSTMDEGWLFSPLEALKQELRVDNDDVANINNVKYKLEHDETSNNDSKLREVINLLQVVNSQ